MNELIFLVEEAPEGGYTARALREAIFTEADDLDSLHGQIRDAVRCHFEEGKEPSVLRLQRREIGSTEPTGDKPFGFVVMAPILANLVA